MTRWGLVAAVGLVLAAAACSDDGGTAGDGPASTTTATDAATTTVGDDGAGASPLGLATTEALDFGLFGDLPEPNTQTSSADRPPLAAFGDSAALIGPAGGLVRLDPEEGATVTPTEGIDSGEGTDQARAVDLLASDGDGLLAIGHEVEQTADVVPSTRPIAWRSADGDTWEALDLSGLEDGANEVTVTAVIADPDGGFLAGGEVEDGDQTVLTLWSSPDGETWETVTADGLDHVEGEDQSEEHLYGLAVVADTMVATVTREGQDDERLSIMRTTLEGGWQEADVDGLDELDLANSDVIPALTAVGDQFVLFASTAVDPSEEFGERTPTLFVSGDAEDWAAIPLDGPTLPDPFFVQAITPTATGAVAVAEGTDALNVWRFTR